LNYSSRDAPLAGSNALSSGGQSTGQQIQALYVKICKPLSIYNLHHGVVRGMK